MMLKVMLKENDEEKGRIWVSINFRQFFIFSQFLNKNKGIFC